MKVIVAAICGQKRYPELAYPIGAALAPDYGLRFYGSHRIEPHNRERQRLGARHDGRMRTKA